MNFSYVAGIIDGEGCISFSHQKKDNKFIPYVSISNTNLNLITRVKDFCKENGINSRISTRKSKIETHKTCYGLSFFYNNATKLINNVKSELIVKKEQAKLLTENYVAYVSRNGKYTEENLRIKLSIIHKIRNLNSRSTKELVHENSL